MATRQLLLSSSLVAIVVTSLAAAPLPLVVDVSPFAAEHASSILRVTLPELHGFVSSRGSISEGCSPAELELDLDPSWAAVHLTAAAERYTLELSPEGRLRITGAGLLGLAYSIHDLREFLALSSLEAAAGGDSCAPWWRTVAAFFERGPPSPPHFALRTYSEEGQLLALPDRGYYLPDESAADVAAIQAEADALEAEVVPAILRLRMNTLTVLHSDVEDYVSYDLLPRYLPGAPVIYAQNDTHRVRAAGILGVMAPWIEHLADAYGIAYYIQVYELSSPPGVCTAGSNSTPPLLNCSLGGSDLVPLLQARYSELRDALPFLAGIVLTVEDSWTPRAGYVFNVVWSTPPQLPAAVTAFWDAVVGTAGLRMVFRLWLFGQQVDWPQLRDGSPVATAFSVKQTQGDFLLDFPINPLLLCTGNGSDGSGLCPARDRPLMVEVDAFRQYNGWTSGVCWMGAQWGPRLATAVTSGVQMLNMWGAWAPGCTWPDSGPQLVNGTAGTFKSWRSWWGAYRMFNATPTNGGFALGAQANAYLSYRLAWDSPPPGNDTRGLALDFGALYYGQANAAAVADLLEASLGAWAATSVPSAIGDFTLFWTMMQHADGQFESLVKKGVTAADTLAAAQASTTAAAAMAAALTRIDPSEVPSTNPAGYAGAARGVGLSAAYLRAYFSWRAAGLAFAQLPAQPGANATACAEARAGLGNVTADVAAFGASYPIEGVQWAVSGLSQELWSAPSFLTNTFERDMAGWEGRWAAQLATACL